MLLKQTGYEWAENSPGASHSKHHADGGAAHFRIIGCRSEIVQDVLPAQNAESGRAHTDDVEHVHVDQNAIPARNGPAQPPHGHRFAVLSASVRDVATHERTDK